MCYTIIILLLQKYLVILFMFNTLILSVSFTCSLKGSFMLTVVRTYRSDYKFLYSSFRYYSIEYNR